MNNMADSVTNNDIKKLAVSSLSSRNFVGYTKFQKICLYYCNEVRRKKNIQIYFILFLSLQNVQQLGLISVLYYCMCLLQYGQWSSGQAPTEFNKMPVMASYLGQSNWTVWDVR